MLHADLKMSSRVVTLSKDLITKYVQIADAKW